MDNTNTTTTCEIGNFGPIYRQFENKPKEAIEYLCKTKNGDCIHALYREDIGFIDIIWGEVTDPIKHKGYGLAHIILKGNNFKIIISKKAYKNNLIMNKTFVLTSFSIK